MLSTPTPLEQGVLFLLLVAFVAFLIGHEWGRVGALRALGWVWAVISSAVAGFAQAFHYVLPAKERDGSLPPVRLGIWIGLNALIVLAWLTGGLFGRNSDVYEILGWINLLFAYVNLLLVTGAYAALQEGVAIMNAEEGWHDRKFERDALAVKHAGFVAGSVVFLGLQTAAVLHWLQSMHGVDFVAVRSSYGSTYLDIIVVLLNALPFAQILVGAPRLVDGAAFAPGWGFVFGQAFALFGAALLISTLIDFVRQHLAFRKMIDRLLVMTDNSMRPIVLAKFKRAPNAIKRYLGRRFARESSPERQIKLLELAVERPMWSAPKMFIGRLHGLVPEVKARGGRVILYFMTARGDGLDDAMRVETVKRAKDSFRDLGGEDHALVALIILPCLEGLCAAGDQAVAYTWKKQIRDKPSLQILLKSLLAGERAERAASLMVTACAGEVWPTLIRSMRNMSDDARARLLNEMAEAVTQGRLRAAHYWPPISDAANDELLAGARGAFETGLMRVRAAIVAKQKEFHSRPAIPSTQAAAA